MEGDRWAALTVQAAFERTVDFAHADPLDPLWWLRLRVMLRATAARNASRLDELWLLRHATALTRENLTPGAIDGLLEAADGCVSRITRRLYPWEHRSGENGRETAVRDLTARWKEVYGDPDDPAVAARIEATARALKAADRSRRA